MIGEVDYRTLKHFSRFVDNQPKAPMLGKEGQPMPAFVLGDPALVSGCYLSRAQAFLHGRRLDAEALCNELGIDLDRALLKFDHVHRRHILEFADQGDMRRSPPRSKPTGERLVCTKT